MLYSQQEKQFIVEKYNQTQQAVPQYKEPGEPNSLLVMHLVTDLANKIPYQNEYSLKKNDAIDNLLEMFTQNPRLFIRKAVQGADISIGTTYCILRQALNLQPFNIQSYQKLKNEDFEKREQFAQRFLTEEEKQYFICSNESMFCLSNSEKKQNNRLWMKQKPETDLQSKATYLVWNFGKQNLWTLYNGSYVNKDTYLEMLKNYFWTKHRRVDNYQNYYFLQDGSSSHTSNEVQSWLNEKFGDHFLDKNEWPPKSSDLNSCDFFLLGDLKSRVCLQSITKQLRRFKEKYRKRNQNYFQRNIKKRFLKFIKKMLKYYSIKWWKH